MTEGGVRRENGKELGFTGVPRYFYVNFLKSEANWVTKNNYNIHYRCKTKFTQEGLYIIDLCERIVIISKSMINEMAYVNFSL